MKNNLKKMLSYYRPYRGIFIADMCFAFGEAAVRTGNCMRCSGRDGISE